MVLYTSFTIDSCWAAWIHSTQHLAFSIQSAQQFGSVSTGILLSKAAVMETKTLNHRGRGGARRKTYSAADLQGAEGKANPGPTFIIMLSFVSIGFVCFD
jgi:hypothetical protein